MRRVDRYVIGSFVAGRLAEAAGVQSVATGEAPAAGAAPSEGVER